MTLSQAPNYQWLEPWHYEPPRQNNGLEVELRREVGPAHALYQLVDSAVAIARRFDQDDVLFAIHEGTDQILLAAEVHLTWSLKQESHRELPWVTFLGSFDEWAARRMAADNAERFAERQDK